jgi:23S rRNA (adenine2503-C2)-methyltransferase
MEKTDIKNFTCSGLERIMGLKGRPGYRARQIFGWLFKYGVKDFSAMTNLPADLLRELEADFFISNPDCIRKEISKDGTVKLLFRINGPFYIETVIMPSRARNTICLSSQVGCRFRCAFCASGMKGFTRDLSVPEILNQILFARDMLRTGITNYVFMGMGEPLDNYENLVTALKIMNDKNGLNIGARRITISTCGIVPAIKKLSGLNMQVNLSLSLHAVTDEKRTRLMPVNKRFPLNAVIGALSDHIKKTGRIITLEYILIPGLNDMPSDADDLAGIARLLRARINLIPYSKVSNIKFNVPDKRQIQIFLNRVKCRHEHITLRASKGGDIQAACGQLAGRQAGRKASSASDRAFDGV